MVENVLYTNKKHLSKDTRDEITRFYEDPFNVEIKRPNYDPCSIWAPCARGPRHYLFYATTHAPYHSAPPDIKAVVKYARGLGCAWVVLQCGGPVIPNLPILRD